MFAAVTTHLTGRKFLAPFFMNTVYISILVRVCLDIAGE